LLSQAKKPIGALIGGLGGSTSGRGRFQTRPYFVVYYTAVCQRSAFRYQKSAISLDASGISFQPLHWSL